MEQFVWYNHLMRRKRALSYILSKNLLIFYPIYVVTAVTVRLQKSISSTFFAMWNFLLRENRPIMCSAFQRAYYVLCFSSCDFEGCRFIGISLMKHEYGLLTWIVLSLYRLKFIYAGVFTNFF